MTPHSSGTHFHMSVIIDTINVELYYITFTFLYTLPAGEQIRDIQKQSHVVPVNT